MKQVFRQRVELNIEGATAHVLLSNEEKLNALDLNVLQGLVDAANVIKRDKKIRAVLMYGKGDNFSSGLDVATVAKEPVKVFRNLFKFTKSRNLFQHCALVWRDLPVPVIAVLQGYCYGGGMQIAMAADFRIADANAQFSIMESKWGLIPDMSGLVTFPEQMRLDQALLLTMSSDIIDAQQAKAVGLVTEVSDQPMQLAEQWIEKLENRSPDVLAASKKLFHRTWANSSERKKLFWETWVQIKLLLGKNQKIAVARETGKHKEYLPRK